MLHKLLGILLLVQVVFGQSRFGGVLLLGDSVASTYNVIAYNCSGTDTALLDIVVNQRAGVKRTWASTGSTKADSSGNYTPLKTAIISGDSLYFDATSSVNATQTADMSYNAINFTGYSGTYNDGGYNDTVGGAFTMAAGATLTATGIWVQTGDANWTFAGTCNTSSMKLKLRGTGTIFGGTKTINRLWIEHPGKTTTLSAATTITVAGGDSILVINGGTFTINQAVNINATSTGTPIIQNGTINGTTTSYFQISSNNVTATVPAITWGGTSNVFYMGNASGCNGTFNLSGAYSSNSVFYLTGAAANRLLTYRSNGYGVTCGAMYCGQQTANGTSAYYFSHSSVAVASYGGNVYNMAGGTIYMDTSTWTCSGNWIFGTNTAINPGRSTVTFTGVAAAITSNNKKFYDVVINSAGTVTATDTVKGRLRTILAGAKNGPWRFCGIESITPVKGKVAQSVVLRGTWDDTSTLVIKLDTTTAMISAKTDSTATIVIPAAGNGLKSVIVSSYGLSDTLAGGFFIKKCHWKFVSYRRKWVCY